jgi:hypothetical protein
MDASDYVLWFEKGIVVTSFPFFSLKVGDIVNAFDLSICSSSSCRLNKRRKLRSPWTYVHMIPEVS